MHRLSSSSLPGIFVLLMACAAAGQTTRPQPPILPPADRRPTTMPTTELPDLPSRRLGAPFASRAAGISFRPPLGGAQARRMAYGAEIVQYGNPEDKWLLKVSRVTFDVPATLLPPTPRPADAPPAILDEATRQLLLQNANTDILRKDVVNVGPLDVGLLYSRFTQGGAHRLRQQAFVQASPQFYFVFDFMTPSGRGPQDKPEDEDPAERMAMDIFRAMLDTVQLLDQREILKDNDQRLLRTRSLQVGLEDRIKRAVVPDQYFRVIRNGKDVGWIYIAEELADYQGNSGLISATVTYGHPDDTTVVNISTEAFSGLDPKQANETWFTMNNSTQAGQRVAVTEAGQSGKRTRRVLDKTARGDALDPRQPAVREIEQYTLTVNQTGLPGPKKVDRDLPPYYLPQALATMLPRSVPPREAAGYLFATWIGAEQELIYRYYDVQPEREVLFNGNSIRAVTVKDRIGLEGDPTYHYLSPDGKYLGSTTAATGVIIVATDMQSLLRVWPDAKILRPHLLQGR